MTKKPGDKEVEGPPSVFKITPEKVVLVSGERRKKGRRIECLTAAGVWGETR